MRTFIAKYATRRNLLVLLAFMLLFNFVWFPQFLPKGEHAVMLDTEFAYTAEDAYEIIGNYSDGMRQRYILGELTLDLVFPLVYAFFFAFLIFFLTRNATLALFPFLPMFFDYLENTGIVILLSAWPDKIMWLAKATAILSMLKWSLVMITVLIMTAGFIRLLIFRLRKPGNGL